VSVFSFGLLVGLGVRELGLWLGVWLGFALYYISVAVDLLRLVLSSLESFLDVQKNAEG